MAQNFQGGEPHHSKSILQTFVEAKRRGPKTKPNYDPNYVGGGTKIFNWIKDLFTSKPTFGGGAYGGGGAGGRVNDNTSSQTPKTDRYNVKQERKVTVNESASPKKEPTTTKKKPVLRPFPNQELSTVTVIAKRPDYIANFAPIPQQSVENPQIHVPVNHYNRRTTRELIRAKGLNPYHMGSLQRKQLRKYLNGELTADQVSPTVLSIAQKQIQPDNQVWNNYYPDNQPRSGVIPDVMEFFRPS